MHGERTMFLLSEIMNGLMLNLDQFSEELWQKLSLLNLPSVDDKVACVLTPYLRFYLYPGEKKFNMHKDGSKEFNGNHAFYTMLIYLNTLSDSGATRFSESDLHVYPEAGKALTFRHNLWHAGMPVGAKIKYVLRADILFSWSVNLRPCCIEIERNILIELLKF